MENLPQIPAPIRNPEIKYTDLFINNEFVPAVSGKRFAVTNPATGEKIADVAEADAADVDKAVKAARAAFHKDSEWRRMDASARGRLMHKFADLIERDHTYLASLESLDNGKPYKYSYLVDVRVLVNSLRYYAGMADKVYGRTIPADGDVQCHTVRDPIGVVGAILPWNFPVAMFAMKAAPALAAGCTIVIKQSEETPLTTLYLAALAKEVGIPAGVINVVPGYGATAGNAIACHMDIDKVSFTGSTVVGKLVVQNAARSNMKKVTLECGGKSPLIVFDDADLDKAVEVAHAGLFFNSGQCCNAGSRLFVQEGVYDKFVEACVTRAKKAVTGDPFDMATDLGPITFKRQHDKVMSLIESGQKEGAKLALGGKVLGDKGHFVEPTIFADVKDEMRIAREEIFGPVMQILKFKTVEEVLERANNTTYGLAAGVITSDINKAHYVVKHLQAGTVWVNFHLPCYICSIFILFYFILLNLTGQQLP